MKVSDMNSINNDQTIRITDVGEIGRAIRSARKAQGLTQLEFADITGVGVRFLSELERGKPTAEIGLVLEVIANLGYDIALQKRQLGSKFRPRAPSADGRLEDES